MFAIGCSCFRTIMTWTYSQWSSSAQFTSICRKFSSHWIFWCKNSVGSMRWLVNGARTKRLLLFFESNFICFKFSRCCTLFTILISWNHIISIWLIKVFIQGLFFWKSSCSRKLSTVLSFKFNCIVILIYRTWASWADWFTQFLCKKRSAPLSPCTRTKSIYWILFFVWKLLFSKWG